jgi:hypothetical protein
MSVFCDGFQASKGLMTIIKRKMHQNGLPYKMGLQMYAVL